MNIYFDARFPDKITRVVPSVGLTGEEVDAIFNLARISGVRSHPSVEWIDERFYVARISLDGEFENFV